jgi:large subunit ribosomal protein L10e
MYRSIKQQANTRREYMGGVPSSRITQFDMGNRSGKFSSNIALYAVEKCQIRHTALESARITANRSLERTIGLSNYHFKIAVFPHHVLRENKQATGAGADRVSQGMRASFGKAVGTAARLKNDQIIMYVETNIENTLAAKKALKKASMKLPTPCYTQIKNAS